jgi:hypothetical protein
MVKASHRLESTRVVGWSNYIATHNTTQKNMTEREHVAFLNMWLDRYLFYGQSYTPTFNYQVLEEKISVNLEIPLGKYLLGALYHLMNQVSQDLMKNETIPTITGPWWLLQLWLNLQLQKYVVRDLRSLKFPSLNFKEEGHLSESNKTHRCMSFGEATSAITITSSVGHLFKLFYKGLPEDILEWFIYSDILEFKQSFSFRFQSEYND